MALREGTVFLTPTVSVHVMEAAEPGPTALVQGGIHGDEIAGVHALEELLEAGVRPARGRLIVIPTMNRAAYRARQRAAPGGLDLNRCFPGDATAPEPERRLARRFMDLVEAERPALMATLHESHKRYDPAVTPSFGQTLVYGVDPMPPIVGTTPSPPRRPR
jgi:predicted deacylase